MCINDNIIIIIQFILHYRCNVFVLHDNDIQLDHKWQQIGWQHRQTNYSFPNGNKMQYDYIQ